MSNLNVGHLVLKAKMKEDWQQKNEQTLTGLNSDSHRNAALTAYSNKHLKPVVWEVLYLLILLDRGQMKHLFFLRAGTFDNVCLLRQNQHLLWQTETPGEISKQLLERFGRWTQVLSLQMEKKHVDTV